MGGLSRIPITSVITYADYLGMNQRETDDLMKVIKTLDTRKCRLVSDKQAEKSAATR